jgi:hypothetical protein
LGFFIALYFQHKVTLLVWMKRASPLTTTDAKALPFTARNEEKKVEEKKGVTVLTPDSIVPNPVSQRTDPNP